MKHLKLLPITLAVGSVLGSAPLLAATDAEIDALTQRIQELEKKVETDYVYQQQSIDLPPDVEVPKGIIFSGYARYGNAYASSDERMVNAYGALNGNATGRLGNENYGGEFQLGKVLKSDKGAVWDLVLMVDHYQDRTWWEAGSTEADGGLNVKKMYAGVTNLFESQPSLYFWGGRDFHQRTATDLNDYFWVMHDGQGGGFKNLDLGFGEFNLSFVGQVDDDMVGDNGRYAITSKLHDIDLGGASLNIYANYGFASDTIEDRDSRDVKSYQLAGELMMNGQRLVVRYGDNAKDSAFDLVDDEQAFLVSVDGFYQVTPKASFAYVAAYQSLEVADDQDRSNYNINLRPGYAWDDVNSTWVELGYSLVDYDKIDATNKAWKVTVSQNITFGPFMSSRPMLRFYATFGNSDNEFAGYADDKVTITTSDNDTVTVGAMFEAWW
ncbi:carbohydrate porin [Vibrio sp. AK197]